MHTRGQERGTLKLKLMNSRVKLHATPTKVTQVTVELEKFTS